MLAALLGVELFAFLLILTRMASMLSFMPAIGETAIPVRIRLAVAAALSFLILPLYASQAPAIPVDILAMVGMVLLEIAIGLFIALTARLMMTALNVAGTVIAFQSGLAAAQSFDPTQGSQGATLARFLTLFGLIVIFATDLHLLVIKAMVFSFETFPIGYLPAVEDMAAAIVDVAAAAFAMGIAISAPFLVYGLVFNIALGLLARLMPQLPVFFVAMPANIFLSFIILLVVMSAMLMAFANYFEAGLARFLG